MGTRWQDPDGTRHYIGNLYQCDLVGSPFSAAELAEANARVDSLCWVSVDDDDALAELIESDRDWLCGNEDACTFTCEYTPERCDLADF